MQKKKMVENALKNANNLLNKKELRDKLPEKITYQAINSILKDLENKGKIITGKKGILWIYNPSKNLRRAIKTGLEV